MAQDPVKLSNYDAVGQMAPRPMGYVNGDDEVVAASADTPMPVSGWAGITASASFTPAAAAYGANDIMDVAKEFAFTFADGRAIPAGSLIRILAAVMMIDVAALQANEAAYALQCYSVTPPSAQADNAAWSLASADLPSYRGLISLGTPIDLGAALHVKTANID
ncbi:MAG: hypothetical protein AB7F51_16910, partial [Pseudorhodoplanes sp.]